ncbi:hypothetical protein B0F87_108127 [Methylobacter tundripaludum]|uniref:Uncharacterized protein n=1 Tax=Methylobacter tundripaludum TaxID=173365 RepID=A0A2S6HB82_9GAMM|nr:hypothetical protein [Methylobacter tundripaludum]PPK74653.1 hypothetical protein B0F87_108127 [Methylobacter tundripaludum]
MKPLILFILLLQTVWVALAGSSAANAAVLSGLPIQSTAERPALLLELGSTPPSVGEGDKTTRVFTGEVYAHEGDASIQTDKDEISSLHPGFGSWKVSFRFKVKPGFPAKPYTFWARWRQGGDPNVCVQSFEVWAGPDTSRLELRATLSMKPKGWDYAWIVAESPVSLKADDAVIEVRDSGAGHDAKVFDAFLLASPLSVLPTSGTADRPLVLLDLGNAPALALAATEKDPALQVQLGTATAGPGAESVLTEKDEVQVFHPGFGNWGANFRFELTPAIAPGQYRFYARYKSGGEVSQVSQNFTVKAGVKPDEMATRGDFALTNTTPWEYQWLQAAATVTVLPGDRWLEINNTGKADGAKVFDAFLLKLETSLGDWMTAAQAQARNRFLALTKAVPAANRRLIVLDGKGGKDEVLFRGLASDAARPSYEKLSVSYLIGPEAEALSSSLNLPALPAALMTDDHYGILGVLAQPNSEQDVPRFLADPGKGGMMPTPPAVAGETAKPLKGGIPYAWLVGGLQDGLSGVSVFGLDSETVLRPNPGQPYLSLQMMGGEMRAWRVAPTEVNGVADIEANTQHAYGWSRGSGYAQLYLHVDQPTQALLHLKQSGIKTGGWLDGKPFKLADDPNPPAGFSSSPGEQVKKLLKGLTTEGLVATALSVRPEAPQLATLDLSPGWHSLLVKLVMQHDQGQRFYFAGLFADPAGKPLDSIKTQPTDPDADLALNGIAAKLRPLIFVDAPANLPHPGDSLKLRVDMRWHPVLEETALSAPLPRFPAKLRLRLVDYSGNQVAAQEITGLFPGEAEVDFGKVSEPGYYAVYSSLYTPDGKLIMSYPADGFSVVGGAAEQKHRLDKKKLWNNDYYALADGDKSFKQDGGYFSWLERMGIYKSYGSYPGFDPQYRAKWEQAKQRGLVLFADSSGDSAWLNDNQADGQSFINTAAPFTKFFKSTNEIDIRSEPEWQKLREPVHWVQRAKWEYEQAHKQRGDAHYVGGSLVRPGDKEGAGQWFKQVLELGLDHYQDAWDVHAYPQQAPRFGGAIGNGENEDERGVLATYASLGRKNSLPFWLGETGAKAMHGLTGRRWQAEQVAKMIAWVNSRSDYLGIAFCIGHEYDLAYGRIWDYSMGHKPGEAALYTASALIDGLPYRAFDTKDANIQAAYFGETLMIWRTDEAVGNWRQQLVPGKTWVLVDVVGHVQELTVDASGYADISISASPVYALSRDVYERLTRN